MLRFTVKHMSVRMGKNILIALSIVVTLMVSLLSFNISNQVKDGVVGTYKYYDTIVGATGSQTQLVLNTMFYTDKAPGLIPYEIYENLIDDTRVSVAIPFAEGDNYNNARIIGTHSEYLNEYTLVEGRVFNEIFEVVLGYNIARNKGLGLGDTFYSVHGLTSDINSHEHKTEDKRYTVVGILAKTNTSADNVIFTDIESVWETHETEVHDDEEHMITAVLLKCVSFNAQNSISMEYNKLSGIQAVNPSEVMRELLSSIDLTKNIVYVLCGIILVMNLFIISVITMLYMYDVKKDIIMLRLIGVSKGKIESIVYLQTLIISVVSSLLGFSLSRVLIRVAGSITASRGIVLNTYRLYSAEFIILVAVILITFLPVILSVKNTLKGALVDES